MVFSSQARNVMFCRAYMAKSYTGEAKAIKVRVSYDEAGNFPLTEMQLSLDTCTNKFMALVKGHQELNNVRRLDISMTKQIEKLLMRNDNRAAA
jgi:hypothetical protein